MTTSAAMTAAIARLDKLAALGMGMAERLHDAAYATDERDDLAHVGMAFHHVSRGVRQTIALQLRLASGWVPAARAPEPAREPALATSPPADGPAPVRRESIGWNEYERLDCEERPDDLDHLADAAEDEPVDLERLEAALEAGVARFRRGVTALRPRPRLTTVPKPASRARLMTGTAALRVVDTS